MKLKVLRPVNKKFQISSPFGWRMHPLTGKKEFHNGTDFACPEQTEVVAMADGQVIKVGYENEEDHGQGFGLRIIQKAKINKEIFYLYYAHLSLTNVRINYFVKKGEEIALSGNTGFTSGAHLDVRVRENDTGDFRDIDFYDRKECQI